MLTDMIDGAVYAIWHNGGRLKYPTMHKVMQGDVDWTEFDQAVFCLVASVIAHNIPIYKNKERCLRAFEECWKSACTFARTNLDEQYFKVRSSDGFDKYLAYGSFNIPQLEFGDDTHEIFQAGSGSKIPDFRAVDGTTFEAKYKYFSGSPSTCHYANYLLDYDDSEVCVYQLNNNKIVGDTPLAIFTKAIPPRNHRLSVGVRQELMDIIEGGELIPEVETKLAGYGFKWNP